MNTELSQWFRAGVQERMQKVADAEESITVATDRIMADPTPETLAATTMVADELLAAANAGLAWLRDHPCPITHVGATLQEAFHQFQVASETLINMGTGQLPMTAASGGIAAQAIALARRSLYDAAFGFASEIAK
jgi:hypothetical protein